MNALMGDSRDRVREFLDLYAKVVQRPLNLAELEADDVYAFQAFERAQRSGDGELQELAIALQAQRQVRMESLAAAARMSDTYRLTTLARRATPDGAASDPAYAATMAAITGKFKAIGGAMPPLVDAIATTAEVDFLAMRRADIAADIAAEVITPVEAEAGLPINADVAAALDALIAPVPDSVAGNAAASALTGAPAAETAQAERRSPAARLDPRELAMAASLLRLYREQFGVPLDTGRFFLDDEYGRAVIGESRGAGSAALAALAGRYLDENGLPRRHRRGSGIAPPAEATIMDNRTLTLACDGTLQTLGDFHGIATCCVVRNEEFGGPVVLSARGFMQALIAPGHAIACRTALVRVQGPAGAVVVLDFVGFPDLAT